MHAAQTAQTAAGRPDVGQRRNGDAVVIANHHGFYLAGAMNKHPDLAVQLRRNCRQQAGAFPADNLLGWDLFVGESFQIPQLLGLEPVGIAANRSDGRTP